MVKYISHFKDIGRVYLFHMKKIKKYYLKKITEMSAWKHQHHHCSVVNVYLWLWDQRQIVFLIKRKGG